MSTTASQYTGTPVVLGYVTMYGGKASDREKRLAFRAKDGTVVVRRKSFDLGWQITTDQRVIDSLCRGRRRQGNPRWREEQGMT